jgi:hypothetical protein
MYFLDKGLKQFPFGSRRVIWWLLAVVGGCVCFLAVAPMILHFVWPWM